MVHGDTLGDRMKQYEAASRWLLATWREVRGG